MQLSKNKNKNVSIYDEIELEKEHYQNDLAYGLDDQHNKYSQ